MKERSKLYRTHNNRKSHELGKRLYQGEHQEEEMKVDEQNITKRKKLDGGQMLIMNQTQPTPNKKGLQEKWLSLIT